MLRWNLHLSEITASNSRKALPVKMKKEGKRAVLFVKHKLLCYDSFYFVSGDSNRLLLIKYWCLLI